MWRTRHAGPYRVKIEKGTEKKIWVLFNKLIISKENHLRGESEYVFYINKNWPILDLYKQT